MGTKLPRRLTTNARDTTSMEKEEKQTSTMNLRHRGLLEEEESL